MNEQAINDLYNLAKQNGYTKSLDEFVNLMYTNDNAFNDMYSLAQSNGYQKSQDDFSVLIGKKKSESQPQPTAQAQPMAQKPQAPDAMASSSGAPSSALPSTKVRVEEFKGFDEETLKRMKASATEAPQMALMRHEKKAEKQREEDRAQVLAEIETWKDYKEQPYFEGELGNTIRSIPFGIGGFIDDMGRAYGAGATQADIASPSNSLMISGASSSPEQIKKYVDAAKALNKYGPSDEMVAFTKAIEEDNGGAWGFIKGLIQNPSVAPEVMLSSVRALFNSASGATAGTVIGGAAAGGAAFGGVGAGPAALASIPYAMGAAGATLETASSFAEFMNEELQKRGLELSEENVKTILEDENALSSMRNRALTRGVTIGVIDAFTGRVAGRVGAKIGKGAGTAAKVKAGLASSGIEAVGGAGGEATARALVGQEMDIAEIGLEGVGEMPMATIDVAAEVLRSPRYKINGEVRSAEDVKNIINTASAEELQKINFDIRNDRNGFNQQIQDKIVTNQVRNEIKDASPDIDDESLNQLTTLEMELRKVEGNKTQTGRDKANQIRSQIREVQQAAAEKKAAPSEAKPITYDQLSDEAKTMVEREVDLYQSNIDAAKENNREPDERDVSQLELLKSDPVTFLEQVVSTTSSEERKTLAEQALTKIKEEQNAIQVETAGQVPVQPTARPSQEMAEGEPQAEPQGVTEEGKVKEEIPEVEAVETVDVSKGFTDYNPQDLKIGEEVYYSFDGKSYSKGKVVNRPSAAKQNVYTIENENGVPTVIIYGGERTNVTLKKPQAEPQVTAQAGVEEEVSRLEQAFGGEFAETEQLLPVTVEASTLEAVPTERKMEVTFTQEDGTVSPLMGNEQMVSDLYEKAVAIPETQRTAAQQSVVDAVKVSLRTPVTPSGVSVSNKAQVAELETKTTDTNKKKIIKAATTAINTLKSIFPDMDIVIHDNEGSYDSQMGQVNGRTGSAGNFAVTRNAQGKIVGGRIDINLSRANMRTVAHEVAHAVMLKAFGDNPALFKVFRDRISKILTETRIKSLNDFASQYAENDSHEEFLVELSAALGEAQEQLKPTTVQKIAELINKVVSKITGGKVQPFSGTVQTNELIDFLNTMSSAIGKGEAIQVKEGETKGAAGVVSKAQVSVKDIDVKDIRTKSRSGKRVSKGLSVRTKNKVKVVEEAEDLSLDYVKKNAPEAFISNAKIIADYPIVSGIKKFTSIKTLEDAQEVYDIFSRQVADNLKYLIDNFRQDLKDIATLWYDGANILAQNFSKKYGITTEQAAGIIASLSPQKDWYQNVRLAEMVMMAFKENPVMTKEMVEKQKNVIAEGLKEYTKALNKAKLKYKKSRSKANAESLNKEIKSYEKYINSTQIVLDNLTKLIGTDMNSAPDYMKQYYVRLFHEVNTTKDYDILSPDGKVIGVAKKKDGTKAQVAWGSYTEIGKAVAIYLDGSQENITKTLGEMHKIRNFYNNIIDPMSPDRDVTMDTHAVAAALLLPLSGKSKQVQANFGTGTANSAPFGIKGLYYAFAEGYNLAAKETGLLPRQVQSITWEAVRGLFTDDFKRDKKKVADINSIVDNYVNKKITLDEARNQITEYAGGIKDPSWAGGPLQEESTGDVEEGVVGRGGKEVGPDTVGAKRGGKGGLTTVSKAQVATEVKEMGETFTVSKAQVDAYHGSPYDFDRFTTEKIGTGEGAQAFGWGLYFTDLKNIAERYANKLAKTTFMGKAFDENPMLEKLRIGLDDEHSNFYNQYSGRITNISEFKDYLDDQYEYLLGESQKPIDENHPMVKRMMSDNDYSKQKIDNARNTIAKFKSPEWKEKVKKLNEVVDDEGLKKVFLEDFIKSEKFAISFLYEAMKYWSSRADRLSRTINFVKNDIKRDLNYFKYLRDNIDKFQLSKKLYQVSLHQGKTPDQYTWLEWDKPVSDSIYNSVGKKLKSNGKFLNELFKDKPDGLFFYKRISQILGGDKEASLFLLKNGIDGVKYPAESIARGATSDTARGFNYVVFDENAVTIVSKAQKADQEVRNIVKKARAEGYSEAGIKAFLLKKGFTAQEADTLMSKPEAGKKIELGDELMAGYDRMMAEVDAIIERGLNRNAKQETILANVLKSVRESDAYKNGTDIQKEQIEREVKQAFGEKMKTAPSVGKILGKQVDKVTMTEMSLLKKQLKDLARGARDAKTAISNGTKAVTEMLDKMVKSGSISSAQLKTIIKKFGSLNVLNEKSLNRFIDYMTKVIADADYSSKLENAQSLRKAIKKLSRNKEKNASMRELAKRFVDIDPSLVDDIDAYNEIAQKIKESVKGSTIREGKITQAEMVNIEDSNEYISETMDAQRQKLFDEKAAEIQELLGVDVSDLSYEQLLEMVEKKEKITKYNEGLVRSAIIRMFGTYSSIIEQMFSTSKDPFTGEDIDIDPKKKELVQRFMDMDLNQLTAKQGLEAVDALTNFIQNGSTAKMEAVVSEYTGEKNAMELEEKGIKSEPLKAYFSKGVGRFFAEQFMSLPVMLERMFKGIKRASLFEKMSGLIDLRNKKSDADRKVTDIINDYVDKFYKEKANGEDFNTSYNATERGLVAFMTRNVVGTAKQMAEEFSRRKALIEESIEVLSKGTDAEKAKAELYQKAYDKLLKDSKDGDEVRSKADKKNLEAIDYWKNKWAEIYDDLSDVSENVYNTLLDKDSNYTPDRFTRLDSAGERTPLENDQSMFHGNTNIIYKKKTGVLMEAERPKQLPRFEGKKKAGMYVDLSFDRNNANSMYDALVDINTAATIRQVEAFINSESFDSIIDNPKDAKLLKGRIQQFVRNMRDKNIVESDELSKAARSLNVMATIGVGQALGGIFQPFKQTIPVIVNTMINAGKINMSIPFNTAVNDFLNKSGYAIANRGLASTTELSSIEKLAELAESSKGEKLVKAIEAANKKMLEILLVKADVAVARASWIAYYEKSLQEQGIDTKSIDYSTHELNKEAADYAQRMVDRQQNISDHDLAGKMFTSKAPMNQIFVKAVMPFASFRINQWMRMTTDLSVLKSKTASKQDKRIAARSLAGFTAEMLTFKLISFGIIVLMGTLTKALMGHDEDEEEEKKRIESAKKGQLTSTITDVFSPLPFLDKPVQAGAGWLLNKVQDIMGVAEEEKTTIFEPKKSDFISSLGSFGISTERIMQIVDLVGLSINGKFKDDYGNEKQLSEEDMDVLKNMLGLAVLSTVGLAPAEVNTIVRNSIKFAKKNAKTEKQVQAEKFSPPNGLTKEQFKRYFPEEYEEMYGEGSTYYKMTQPERERKKKIDKKKQKLMDEYYNYQKKSKKDSFGSDGFGEEKQKKDTFGSQGFGEED